MATEDVRTTIQNLPRASGHGTPPRQPLTAEQLEALLAEPDLEDAMRRNLEQKLETIRHREARAAQRAAMSAEEIVASIPRGERW